MNFRKLSLFFLNFIWAMFEIKWNKPKWLWWWWWWWTTRVARVLDTMAQPYSRYMQNSGMINTLIAVGVVEFWSVNPSKFPFINEANCTTSFWTTLDGNKSHQLETGRAVSSFVCLRGRLIFACRHRCVSSHVVASTSFLSADIMAACPGNRMHWDVTTEYIANETDHIINESKAVYDAVGALDASAVTYNNVIKVFFCSLSIVSGRYAE